MITQTRPTERAASLGGVFELGAALREHWVPTLVTLLVVAGAVLGPSALATPTGAAAPGARLEVGWDYVLVAPLANVLDALSVLAVGQHYAVLATLILLFVLWRLARSRRRLGISRRIGAELGAALAALFGLAAFYLYGIIGPRPMAALVPTDPDVVVVDVHSHTHHSHDGRPGFDAEDRRAWHAAAGFDAVYVSDHRTWEGYAEGAPGNPRRAGDGTVLLPALEIVYAGKYTSALGEPERYRSAVEGNYLLDDALRRLALERGVRPTLVLTIPGPLDSVVAATPEAPGFVAIQVTDASPRGLQQSRVDRARLLRMADSLDLAPVAATNNHGWGRTAAAWTLMRIPGWRELAPDELGAAIESAFHDERYGASRVVERRVPWSGADPVALAMTVPAITWNMFGGIGAGERVSWLLWTWAIALAAGPGLASLWAPIDALLARMRRRPDRM